MYYIGYLKSAAKYKLDDVDEYVLGWMSNYDAKWLPYTQVQNEDGDTGESNFGIKGMVQQMKVLRGLMLTTEGKINKMMVIQEKSGAQSQLESLNQEREEMQQKMQDMMQNMQDNQNNEQLELVMKQMREKEKKMNNLKNNLKDINRQEETIDASVQQQQEKQEAQGINQQPQNAQAVSAEKDNAASQKVGRDIEAMKKQLADMQTTINTKVSWPPQSYLVML